MSSASQPEAAAEAPVNFRHSFRVPYGDCDMQGVVFNANYLVYIDDAFDRWIASVLGADYLKQLDVMVKTAAQEWIAAARHPDIVTLEMTVERWGRTSFDVRTDMATADGPVMTARLRYVCVDSTTHRPKPVPDGVRAQLAQSRPTEV
ncbi:MAG: acyl-CoA thioesterase [Pseudomonadota bacterium]